MSATRYWKRKHEAEPSWKLERDSFTYRSSSELDWGQSYFTCCELASRNNIIECDQHGKPLAAESTKDAPLTKADLDAFEARLMANLEALLNPQPEANAR